MIDWTTCTAVNATLIVSRCCRGTRVPVAALFENMKAAPTVQEFLGMVSGAYRTKQHPHASLEHATGLWKWRECGSCSIRVRRFRSAAIFPRTKSLRHTTTLGSNVDERRLTSGSAGYYW